MGRGRKPNSIKKMDYNSVFFNSVGSYVQKINDYLSCQINPEPLSSHIRIAGGFAFKSTDYLEEGIPVIRISDFNNEKIILENVKLYKESESLKKYELESGDIIIALTGGTIAKLGIVQDGIGKLYLNQRVGKFEVLNPSEFESEYVYWIARSVQVIIKELAWGAAIPNVSPKQIEKLRFPIPDRQTQRSIVLFLNDLKDNKVIAGKYYFDAETEAGILFMHERSLHSAGIFTELTHQQTLLKKLRQQILQEAIEGKLTADWREDNPDVEPASEFLARIKAEKEQLIKDKKIKKQKALPPITDEEKPFDLPDGWEWCRLEEVGLFERGKSKHRPRNDECLFIDGKYPFVQTGDVARSKKHRFRVNTYSKLYNEFGLSQSRLWNAGTLCITIAANIAETGFLDIEACFPDSVVGFTSLIDYETSFYVKYFIDATRDEIEKFAPATAQKNINLGIINMLSFPLPSLLEQKEIIAKVERLFAICDRLETQVTQNQIHAKQLMQAVLKEAFQQNSALERAA